MVVARRLVYVGLALLPLLHYRVGSAFDLSDLCFLVAAGFMILTRRPPRRAPPAPAWYFGSFVWILAGVVASAQAVSTTASLQVVVNAIFVFFVLQWMLRQLLDSTARIRAGMVAFVFGSSISAFVAFLQTEFHVLGYSHQASLEGSRAVGLSNQPNIAAVTFALGLVFAIGLVVEMGLRRYWYIGVCIAVLAGALIFSASVSGMSSTLVGCFVLFLTRGFRLRTVVGVLAALAIVYVVAISVQSNGSHFNLDPIARIEQTTGTNTGYNTVNPRVATVEHSWSGIVASPVIGHGLDQATIAVYYDADVGVFYPAHNIVILYWFAGGIFMVAAGALMIGSCFNRLLHGRLRLGRGADRALRDTVLAGCVTVLFFSFQSPEIVDRWLWLPFLLALCFRVGGKTDRSGPEPVPESREAATYSADDIPVPAAGIRPGTVRPGTVRPGTVRPGAIHPARYPASCQRDGAGDEAAVVMGLGEMFDDRILGLDSAHVFMVSAQAVAARARVVVEVGCGRGVLVDTDQPGGAWQDLRGEGRTVIGIDIDAVGEDNPVIDEFRLIGADGRWPLDDGSVDLAVSDFVLEHVTDPERFASELSRVLRPGGVFIARTISRSSVLAAAARVVPNDHHAKALERLQPGREARDVFRTAYKMNTRRDLTRLFDADFELALARRTGLEQYCKPWPRLRRGVAQLERHLPTSMWMALVVFARRRG